ncbi:MAG: Dihydropteroate synthase [Phycisphaerae bacterium]|nr:Dihydropteroate synthase [Phycisphaerae bacterium]
MTRIIGVLNLTRDSFSDGGRFLKPSASAVDVEAACQAALKMVADGAAIVELGAESSHPDAESVGQEEELRRLVPVVERLATAGIAVSVDTSKPGVMRRAVELGARFINDVTGFRAPGAIDAVRDSSAGLIVMHARGDGPRATREPPPSNDIVSDVRTFLAERISELTRQGIARKRIVVDPGMGFFLSAQPESSLTVLRHLDRLRAIGAPLCVSTSRKSFIGKLLDRPADERGAATLATEIWAWNQGVEFIRTHDVRALNDALRILEHIRVAE